MNTSSTNIPTTPSSRPVGAGTTSGRLLAIATIGFIMTMALHPTHVDLQLSADQFHGLTMHNVAVHTLALACLPLWLTGLFGLSRRLGVHRTPVALALGFALLAFIGIALAAITDGLTATAIVQHAYDSQGQARAQWLHSFDLNHLLNQAGAQVYLLATTAAIGLWTAAMPNEGPRARTLKGVGFACLLATLAGFASGYIGTERVGFTLLVVLQAVWQLTASWWLASASDEPMAA